MSWQTETPHQKWPICEIFCFSTRTKITTFFINCAKSLYFTFKSSYFVDSAQNKCLCTHMHTIHPQFCKLFPKKYQNVINSPLFESYPIGKTFEVPPPTSPRTKVWLNQISFRVTPTEIKISEINKKIQPFLLILLIWSGHYSFRLQLKICMMGSIANLPSWQKRGNSTRYGECCHPCS